MHHTMMRTELTLDVIFRRAATHYAHREVVSRRPDKSLHRTTLGEFDQRARRLASALLGLGLRKGDRVATLMWNHSQHLEAYFGIPLAGGVLHTLNLRLHPDEIGFIAAHAHDRFLIVDDVLLPLYLRFKSIAHFEKVIVVRHSATELPVAALDYEAVLATGDVKAALPTLSEEDPLGMCYTSGTTGKPKGVVYSHRAICLHSLAESLADTLGLSQRDAVMPVVPMFHVNAWGLPFAAVMVGARLVFPGPHLDAESLLELMEKEQVTLGAGVPTIWMGIQGALDKEPHRWKLAPSGVRMVVGGSAAPEALIRGFDKHGLTIIHAWGMTETAPIGTVSHLPPHLEGATDAVKYQARARQGIAAPFVELRAVGEAGPVPHDGQSPGELEVRGPWVAREYHELPEETPQRWAADGWFRTGDVVTLDETGNMKITDRTKDLIKSGGEWISSVDLENTLMGHPAVKEAAVIALPHPKWAERPLAVVVLKDGAKATPEEFKEFLAARVAKFQVPDAVVFTDAIPRTSTGKFLKSALRERYRDFTFPG